MKKFLKRFAQKVKENYIFTPAEIAHNLRILNLFETFDTDGSGALDPDELAELYQENGILVSEAQIALLYDHPDVKFTLEEFSNITKDRKRLQTYRKELKKIYKTIKAKAQ